MSPLNYRILVCVGAFPTEKPWGWLSITLRQIMVRLLAKS